MGFERMGEHKVTCPCGKGTKTVWQSEMDDWNRRKVGGETFEADDCQECPKNNATTLSEVRPSPPVAPMLPASVSIRWTSNRAPSADAPGDSHHEVFINGTRTSVHVSAEAAQDHNIESIRAVAEKKIRATFEAGVAPPRVSITNADFRQA